MGTERASRSMEFQPTSLPIAEDRVKDACSPLRRDAGSKVILITGAAGFVGFHSAMALHRRGDGASPRSIPTEGW